MNSPIQKASLKHQQRMVLSKRTGRQNTYQRVPISVLKAVPRHGLYIFAFTFHDHMCTLIDGITPSTTVIQLKDRIAQVHGLATWQQRLFFQGKRLEDARTLQSYSIGEGSFIHIFFAL